MKPVKRPLAVIGYTFFISGSIVLSMPKEYANILLALLLLFLIFHFCTARRYTKYILLITAVFFSSSVYIQNYTLMYENKISQIPTDKREYTGYVKSVNNADSTSYTISILDESLKEKFDVSIFYMEKLELCDIVKIYGKFSPLNRDKYIFSNYSKGTVGKITIENIEVIDEDINTFNYRFLEIKSKILSKAEKLYTGQTYAVVASAGYNDKSYLNQDTKDLFQSAGISHALVVSGFHISVLTLVLIYLTKPLPIFKFIKNIVIVIFVILFMNVIGLSASVVRAGFMAFILILAQNFKFESDSITSLALVGFISALDNPYITRDIGAMLSYCATLGIILSAQWYRNKDFNKYLKSFISACGAVLFIMPVLALAGMDITVLSPVYNLIFAVPVSILCVLSIITPIISFIPHFSFLTNILVQITKNYINLFLNILKLNQKYNSAALVNFASPIFLVMFSSAAVGVFIAVCQFKSNKLKSVFVVFCAVLSAFVYGYLNYNTVTVTAFDSGRETSFYIRYRNKNYLVLSENITCSEAENMLKSFNGGKYEQIYICFKENKNISDFSNITDKVVNVMHTREYKTDIFVLNSEVDEDYKKFTISIGECDIMFGHGKVSADSSTDYYFLGNDKPLEIKAENIYIYGNIPDWMDVDNITQISSDLNIKINTENGTDKIVKDVFNFGYGL